MEPINFKQFRKDFAAAIKSVEKEHNIKIDLKSIRYNEHGFNGTIEATRVADGAVDDPGMVQRAKFLKALPSFPELTTDHFHAEFTSLGVSFRIVGLKPKATKYPIIAKGIEDGKLYKFPLKVTEKIKS